MDADRKTDYSSLYSKKPNNQWIDGENNQQIHPESLNEELKLQLSALNLIRLDLPGVCHTVKTLQ